MSEAVKMLHWFEWLKTHADNLSSEMLSTIRSPLEYLGSSHSCHGNRNFTGDGVSLWWSTFHFASTNQCLGCRSIHLSQAHSARLIQWMRMDAEEHLIRGDSLSSLPCSDMNSIKRSQMVSTDSSAHVLDFNLFQIMIQFIVGFQFIMAARSSVFKKYSGYTQSKDKYQLFR